MKRDGPFLIGCLAGIGADLLLFRLLLASGVGPEPAQMLSFVAAAVGIYVVNARWALPAHDGPGPPSNWARHARFAAVCLPALFLRGAVLALLAQKAAWHPHAAIAVAVVAAWLVNSIGGALFVFPPAGKVPDPSRRRRMAALGVVAYALVLRLCYLGLLELMPQEAYYWNYAQHLDIGYLDHPPMVAWLIRLSTGLLGHSEFAVRCGATVCWLAAAFFCYRLAKNLFDRATALRAVVLLSVLPFFFCVGLLMTPDAPLVAAWAMALYFLERALLGERRRAWWGVGAAIGLGMLSKYTIILLGPAAAAFVLADPRSRRWLVRPEPYLAALLAVLLFSPVIVWNYRNAWASFVFQGPTRLARPASFSLHHLLVALVMLLTPLGVIGAMKQLLPWSMKDHAPTGDAESARRKWRFTVAFVAVPLSVFIAFSLTHRVKLNWTGPLWLAALPALAWDLQSRPIMTRMRAWGRKLWMPAIAVTLVMYACGLHYLSLGLPGVQYPSGSRLLGWRDLASQLRRAEESFNGQDGTKLVIVGMDKYNLASGIAFYRHLAETDQGSLLGKAAVANTIGRHLFGLSSLMYRYWGPRDRYEGHDLMLVGRDPGDLAAERVARHFSRLGPVRQIPTTKNGKPVGRYYYRIGYSYRAGL